MWWHTLVIPALGRLEDQEFQISLDYTGKQIQEINVSRAQRPLRASPHFIGHPLIHSSSSRLASSSYPPSNRCRQTAVTQLRAFPLVHSNLSCHCVLTAQRGQTSSLKPLCKGTHPVSGKEPYDLITSRRVCLSALC